MSWPRSWFDYDRFGDMLPIVVKDLCVSFPGVRCKEVVKTSFSKNDTSNVHREDIKANFITIKVHLNWD